MKCLSILKQLNFCFSEKDVPKDAIFMGTQEVVDGDQKHTDSFYLVPGSKESETKTEVKTSPKVFGVGPKEKDTGIPLSLRKVSPLGNKIASSNKLTFPP
jgi:hypothetical protein